MVKPMEKINIDDFNTINDEEILTVQNKILAELGLCPLDFCLRRRQLQSIASFIEGNDISCFLPTGYGKTLIAALAALITYKDEGKSTIYIGLLKALTAEMKETFEEWLGKVIEEPNVFTVLIVPSSLSKALAN